MQSVTRLTQTTLILVLCTTLACRAGKKDEDNDTATPNSPPVPSGGVVVVTDEDASAVVNLSATDAEGDALEYAIAVMPEHGSLSPEDPGRQSQVTYIPDPDFNGEDSFAYTVADEYDVSAPEVISITVIPVNDAPEVGDDIFVETDEGQPVVIRLTATDIDDTELTFRERRLPSNGTLDLSALPDVTYTPDANFAGEDSFTYLASDGLLDSIENTVVITVVDLNDPPIAADDFYETDEDTELRIGAPGVLQNDTDIDFDALTARLVSEPSHGTVALSSDGSFVYTPGENETSDVTFTYVANDGTADSPEVTVFIELDSINDRPIGVVDEYDLAEDTIAYPGSSVLTNDLEAEIDGDPLEAILATTTSNGELEFFDNGEFVYTPDPDF